MFRTSSPIPYRREEPPAKPAPAPKRGIYADPAVIREILQTIKAEDPLFLDNEANRLAIFSFLQDENAADGFTLANVRVAVRVLSLRDKIQREQPPPPPPVIEEPAEPAEILKPGQLSLKCSKWELEHASKEQVKDWLQRAREAGMK
jgi:hypothetical protein